MRPKLIISSLILFSLLSSCAQLKEIANTLSNLQNLEFTLSNIKSVELAGIPLDSKSSLKDLSTSNLLKLTAAATSKNMPITFNLMVEAKNPNSTASGSSNSSLATITDFPFTLFIDGEQTVTGNVSNDIKVPEAGTVVFPVSIGFEMFNTFGNKGYEKMANLALNLSGFETDEIDLKVRANPKVTTKFGPLNPGEITILSEKL